MRHYRYHPHGYWFNRLSAEDQKKVIDIQNYERNVWLPKLKEMENYIEKDYHFGKYIIRCSSEHIIKHNDYKLASLIDTGDKMFKVYVFIDDGKSYMDSLMSYFCETGKDSAKNNANKFFLAWKKRILEGMTPRDEWTYRRLQQWGIINGMLPSDVENVNLNEIECWWDKTTTIGDFLEKEYEEKGI